MTHGYPQVIPPSGVNVQPETKVGGYNRTVCLLRGAVMWR